MRIIQMAALTALVALTGCSNRGEQKAQFLSDCAETGRAKEECACRFEFASEAFNKEQFDFYAAVLFDRQKDIARYQAELGMLKAAGLITRITMVEATIEQNCTPETASAG